MAIKTSESEREEVMVSKKEMKSQIIMVSIWINPSTFLSTLSTVRKGGRR